MDQISTELDLNNEFVERYYYSRKYLEFVQLNEAERL